MSEISISIESISGEKSKEIQESVPELNLSTDLKVLGVESKDDFLITPFSVKIQYEPSIGHINLRGSAKIAGSEDEFDRIEERFQENNNPDEALVRNILKRCLTEAAIISKTLDIPSPVPLPQSLKK